MSSHPSPRRQAQRPPPTSPPYQAGAFPSGAAVDGFARDMHALADAGDEVLQWAAIVGSGIENTSTSADHYHGDVQGRMDARRLELARQAHELMKLGSRDM